MAKSKISVKSYLKSRIGADFIKINVEWLATGRSYDFDLFIKMTEEHVLFCRKGLNLTEKMAAKLHKRNLFVDKREASHFQAYMEENISDIVRDTTKPLQEKSEAVYSVSSSIVENLLKDPKASSIVRIKDLVTSQMDYVMNNPGAVKSLMSITEHDYYTYTHSVNVSIYLVGLGEKLKMTSAEIKELSLGGMLHDLGKAKISLDIINSTGKLTTEEFDEMKKHPEFGVELLKKSDELSNMVPKNCRYAILDHHEKFCGGGYPRKIKGKEIHLYGRMTKVCDVFDALSTKRSYKKEMSSFESLNLMKERMIEEFDPDIFDQFVQLMAEYSAGQRSA